MACESASPKKAMPRSTTNVPTTAHTMPTMVAAARLRHMKAYCRGWNKKASMNLRGAWPAGRGTPSRAAIVGADAHGLAILPHDQPPAIGGGQPLRCQYFSGRAICHHALVQQDQPVEAGGGHLQIVGR